MVDCATHVIASESATKSLALVMTRPLGCEDDEGDDMANVRRLECSRGISSPRLIKTSKESRWEIIFGWAQTSSCTALYPALSVPMRRWRGRRRLDSRLEN